MLVPIYEYYANDPWRLFYGPDSAVGQGWTKGAVAFYAHSDPAPGTVPIYQYHNEDPWRFSYAADPNLGSGLIKDSVAFYGWATQVPGTLPVYQYHTEDPWRNSYSADPKYATTWEKDFVAFYLVPGSLTWNCDFDDIVYDNITKQATKKDLLQSQLISNPQDGSLPRQSVTISRARSSSFEWGLSETLTSEYKVSFGADFPLGGSFSTEMSVSLELSSHQTWSKTEDITYSITDEVSVDAGHSKLVTGYVDWVDDMTTPFTMTVRISAHTSTEPLTGEQTRDLFLSLNPGATVSLVEEHAIVASLRGAFTGSYGIQTDLAVQDASTT